MNFYQINKLFLRLFGRLYGICDISGFDFSPMEEKAIVLFVVRSERKKENFLNKSFHKCRDKYLEYIKKYPQYANFSYEFMVTSKEDVRKNFGSSYYNVMH